MENLDYEHDIEIDQDALDLEWLEQPSLMLKYAKNLSFWKRQVEKLKTELDLAKARIDKDVRENPDKYGLIKVAETPVFNAVISTDEYQDVYTRLIDAKYEQNVAQAAVDAMEHRKSALENLVRLYGQQYFAGPSIPNDINREWEKKAKEKKSNNAVGNALKRRK